MTDSQKCTAVMLLFTLFLIVPAAATISLQEERVAPHGDSLPAGTQVNTSAIIRIIPQGPTTFTESFTFVLSTDLERAGWNVVVMVDGNPAKVIPQTGKYVFINGYLLSYPTNRDVTVSATLEGMVPDLADGTPFRIIQAEELNNQGQSIGDTEQVIIRRVINTGTGPESSPPRAEVSPVVTIPVSPGATTAVMSSILVPLGIGLAVALIMKRGF
ncbi:MAG: hypothetical protein WBJ52_09005 [Methanoregulaceae archaeon]